MITSHTQIVIVSEILHQQRYICKALPINHLLRMFPNLLSVQLRLADESPVKHELADLIQRDFFQAASNFEEDLDRIQLLQSSLAQASKEGNTPFEWHEKTLGEFYYLIEDISRKFPESGVCFVWHDTLGYNPRRFSILTWKDEVSQLVFQLGSIYSKRACEENQFTDDGLKQACLYFKLAAGCFDVLKGSIAPLQFLDENTILCLEALMIAQAQEVIWLKAISNATMKNSVIARLSIKVSELYQTALGYAEKSESIILDWINQFKVKVHHFDAASHYRMAIVAQDNFEYGIQVARLQRASRCCTKAILFKRYVNPKVIEDLEGLMDAVNENLRSAEKDNDLVYLKPVPHFGELPEIVGVSMVDSEIPKILRERPQEYKQAFANLMPFRVIEIAQAFRERQDQFIVDDIQKPLRALSQMLSTFLTERDLPASIDTIQKPESLPESIIRHSQEISSFGGVKMIELSMDEISNLRQNCVELVSACEERLKIEKYEDELLRSSKGSASWTRSPSLVVAAELSSRIEKMRGYLDQGKQSDGLIGEHYFAIKSKLEVYQGGYELLKRNIPCSSHAKLDPTAGLLLMELRELLVELEKTISNRERFVAGIEIRSRNHAILPVIMDDFKRNMGKFRDSEGAIDASKFEAIYEHHIRYFSNDIAYVELLKQKQMKLEGSIHDANIKFKEARMTSYDQSQKKRYDALQGFELTYSQFLELISNLNEASKFYSDFLQRGGTVLREADDFLYSRREEARELEISITNQHKLSNIEQTMLNGGVSIHSPQAQKANRSFKD